MRPWTRIVALGLIAALAACAAPLPREEVVGAKTVGILNEFPDYPDYALIGTTMFTNKHEDVPDPGAKAYLTAYLSGLLRERGYEVKEVQSRTDPGVDVVIRVIPRDIMHMAESYGYGFWQRHLLGAAINKVSYTALNLMPVKAEREGCGWCYGQSVASVTTGKLPPKWEDLPPDARQVLLKALRGNIEVAVRKAFERTEFVESAETVAAE